MTLEVNFEVTSIMPIEGSKAGGSVLTITGNGFDTSGETISVTVCNQTCTIVENSISSSSLQCLTPGDTTALPVNKPVVVVVLLSKTPVCDLQ